MVNIGGSFLGGILGIGAAALLALGMVTQRYALIHSKDEDVSFGLFTMRKTCGVQARNWAWISGLAIYGVANGMYAPGLLLAPLSLMGSIFTLLLVFNMFFARIVLNEILTPPKVAGALVILAGVSCVAIGTPTDQKNDFTPQDIEDLAKRPVGLIYAICLFGFVISTICLIIYNERTYPMTELAGADAAAESSPSSDVESRNPGIGVEAIERSSPRSKRQGPAGGAPPWIDMIMAVAYPASLGADEGICQLTMQAAMSQSHQCDVNGLDCNRWTVYFCWTVWVIASLATACYMRFVFQRFEVTRALPVEYGTLNVCNVMSGLLFFDESAKMESWQLAMLLTGAVLIVIGLSISTMSKLPFFGDTCGCASFGAPEGCIPEAGESPDHASSVHHIQMRGGTPSTTPHMNPAAGPFPTTPTSLEKNNFGDSVGVLPSAIPTPEPGRVPPILHQSTPRKAL